MTDNLIVLSGGLDSSVLLTQSVNDGENPRAIYFDIGYRSRHSERNSAKFIAHQLNIPLEIVDVSGIFQMVAGFVPNEFLGIGELDKGQPTPFPWVSDPEKKYFEQDYVTGFPVILSLATYYASLAEISNISIGLTKEQFSSGRNIAALTTGWAGLVNNVNPHRNVVIKSPFRNMAKSEVVDLGSGRHAAGSALRCPGVDRMSEHESQVGATFDDLLNRFRSARSPAGQFRRLLTGFRQARSSAECDGQRRPGVPQIAPP